MELQTVIHNDSTPGLNVSSSAGNTCIMDDLGLKIVSALLPSHSFSHSDPSLKLTSPLYKQLACLG